MRNCKPKANCGRVKVSSSARFWFRYWIAGQNRPPSTDDFCLGVGVSERMSAAKVLIAEAGTGDENSNPRHA